MKIKSSGFILTAVAAVVSFAAQAQQSLPYPNTPEKPKLPIEVTPVLDGTSPAPLPGQTPPKPPAPIEVTPVLDRPTPNPIVGRPVQPAPDSYQRVIVKFQDKLATAPLDLADERIKDIKNFGRTRPEVMGHIQRLEKANSIKALHGFDSTFSGFSASVKKEQLAKLRADPSVKAVILDLPIRAFAQVVPYGVRNVGATVSGAALAGDGAANATPGLANVRVLVLDTGVSPLAELNLQEKVDYVGDGVTEDCNGHGTHVAGTIGAVDNLAGVVGVAPGVPLSSLRVLDCNGSGYASSLIKAVEYSSFLAKANPATKYVLNASLGFPRGTQLPELDMALKAAVQSGVTVVTAAGNAGQNSCGTTIVRLSSGSTGTGVLAVSAVDEKGREAGFSNYGTCIATWAPGVNIPSLATSGTITVMNGTSSSAPHVAGAAALVRAVNPSYTPVQVDAEIKKLNKATRVRSKSGSFINLTDVSKVGGLSTPAIASLALEGSSGSTAPSSESTKAPVPADQGSLEPVLVEMPNVEPVFKAPDSHMTTPVKSGIQPPGAVARVTTPAVNFGAVKKNAPPVIRSFSVQNIGKAPLKLEGFNKLPKSVQMLSSTCGGLVQAGRACSITLKMLTNEPTSFSEASTTVSNGVNGTVLLTGRVL